MTNRPIPLTIPMLRLLLDAEQKRININRNHSRYSTTSPATRCVQSNASADSPSRLSRGSTPRRTMHRPY